MTAETFAVVRLPRPRVVTLVSGHADRTAAQTAYLFADPPAVLVRLAGDGFTVLPGKAVAGDPGADPKFGPAVVAAVRARRPRPLSTGLPRPASSAESATGGSRLARSERYTCGSAGQTASDRRWTAATRAEYRTMR